MSPNYSCINNIFLLETILVMMFCLMSFNQFAEPATKEIELAFDGKCSIYGNGSIIFFNVEFRFSKFMELFLANTANEATNNKCLKFLFCYESSCKYLKPQFKIVNDNNNEIWNLCGDNWHGFKINFCLDKDGKLDLRISFSLIGEEISRNIAHLPSAISVFRIQFELNNVRIFYEIDDDQKMEQLFLAKNANKYSFEFGVDGDIVKENFWLYNGNKMLQKDPHPWHVLLDLGLIKNVQKGIYHNDENSTIGHFRIHHPEGCVPKTISTNQTILIECIGIKDVSCEFDIPNDEQCGKRCRKKSMQTILIIVKICPLAQFFVNPTIYFSAFLSNFLESLNLIFIILSKHHREALISGGQSITDETKCPWMVAIEINFIGINNLGVEIPMNGGKCSGAIIHQNFLLTSAHCFHYRPKGTIVEAKLLGIKIYAGHFDLKQATNIIEEKPENLIVHENFIKNIFNESFMYMDVALIKLSRQLKFSEKIRSICLANFELKNEKIVHLAGWGLTQEFDYVNASSGRIPVQPNILQESEAKIIDDGICLPLAIEEIEKDYGEMSEEKFQAFSEIVEELSKFKYCLQGLDNSHAQMGDSGSPMMYSVNGTWFTFGIADNLFLRKSLKDTPLPGWKFILK